MKKRTLPSTGGGGPIVSHAGVVLPSTDGQPRPPLSLTPTISIEAADAGRAVVVLISEACNAGDHERVATLRFFFPTIAERVPEFHALMDELVERRKSTTLDEIMREPGSPGRPRASIGFVALVEQVLAENPGWTAKRAALEIESLQGKTSMSLPGHKRLQNLHSALKEIFALWKRPLYVAAELLTASPWQQPGRASSLERFLETATMTRLSGCVVIHAPEDTVTEGARHVQVISQRPEQSLEPDEPEQPRVSQQPPGKR